MRGRVMELPGAGLLWRKALLLAAALAAAPSALAAPPPSEAPTIAFSRLVTRLGTDQAIWSIGHGILCLPSGGLGRRSDGARLVAGRSEVRDKDRGFEDAFRRYVEAAGLKVEGDPDDLFMQAPETAARFAVAGAIISVRAKLCQGGFDATTVKGTATVEVEWQLYDRTTKKVVAKLTTPGTYATSTFGHDNDRLILYNAVGDSARAMVGSEDFHARLAP